MKERYDPSYSPAPSTPEIHNQINEMEESYETYQEPTPTSHTPQRVPIAGVSRRGASMAVLYCSSLIKL